MRRLAIILGTLLLSGCASLWDIVTDQEKDRIQGALQTAAACQFTQLIQAPMHKTSLYAWNQSWCEAVDLNDRSALSGFDGKRRPLYSDRLCHHDIKFEYTPYDEFCSEYSSNTRLGESPHGVGSWSLNPATRFRLPLLNNMLNTQPMMYRTHYKTVQVADMRIYKPLTEALRIRRGSGECNLEMRVYKRSPGASNLKPLLIFHSGGWRQRGYHLLALESRISEFTDNGFIVFVPFSRMSGEGRASQVCGQASREDIQSDAVDALSWVNKKAPLFGGDGSKVRVMAQGIGAVQAGWLLVTMPDYIERMLLLYPMLDSRELLKAYHAGQWKHDSSRDALTLLLDVPNLKQVDPESDAVISTSFSHQVARLNTPLPTLRMLHGLNDQRIPPSQSASMCSAYGGTGLNPLSASGYDCGTRGYMQILAGADYHLDYCLAGVECPAGKAEARTLVRKALRDARKWLAEGDTAQ